MVLPQLRGKNRLPFLRHKKTLEMFLGRGAISRAQHDIRGMDLLRTNLVENYVPEDSRDLDIIDYLISLDICRILMA